jgi:tRNA(fMet)-specific endonuclease VapC
MNFLLDTSTVSLHIRRPAGLQARFIQYAGRLFLSSLALAELYVLAYRLENPIRRLDSIQELIDDDVAVINFDATCARLAGQVRAKLLKAGTPVPQIDLLIGSVALAYDMTLVTHNTADFQRIPGLRLADWAN